MKSCAFDPGIKAGLEFYCFGVDANHVAHQMGNRAYTANELTPHLFELDTDLVNLGIPIAEAAIQTEDGVLDQKGNPQEPLCYLEVVFGRQGDLWQFVDYIRDKLCNSPVPYADLPLRLYVDETLMLDDGEPNTPVIVEASRPEPIGLEPSTNHYH